ncbi:MAG: DUF1622 domain-containing protein [Clostridia bacterium]|nr:DUF1622 domain-containing protein [Clostridia bacterium]
MHAFKTLFTSGVTIIIHLLEIMGITIICVGAIRDFVCYFTGREVNVRLDLAQSLSLALEFMLGGEILRTVIAHELSDIIIVGAIIVLRVALTLLIHWESKHLEEYEHKEHEKKA